MRIQPIPAIPGVPEEALRDVADVQARAKSAEDFSHSLDKVNAAINSTLEFDQIMRRVVVEGCKAIDAECALIMLREGADWVSRYVHGLPESALDSRMTDEEAPALATAARRKSPFIVNDLSKVDHVPLMAREYGVRSVLLVPLIVRGAAVGVLLFIYRLRVTAFSRQQMDFARRLGASISLALENARLYQAERESAQRESDLREAIQRQLNLLQTALIPGKPSVVEGYNIATEYVPALSGDIGGDFYDVFQTEAGKVGFMIGDVAGKGIKSASLAATSRSIAHAFAYGLSDAGKTLTQANAVLAAEQEDFGPFVTIFLGILDAQSGRILHSNAGHPPPLIHRTSGEVTMLGLGDPPVAIFGGQEYSESETCLKPGDKIVVYTDGISEARRRDAMFGTEGLERSLHRHGALPADQLARAILADVRNWSHGRLSDDAAIMVIEREA